MNISEALSLFNMHHIPYSWGTIIAGYHLGIFDRATIISYAIDQYELGDQSSAMLNIASYFGDPIIDKEAFEKDLNAIATPQPDDKAKWAFILLAELLQKEADALTLHQKIIDLYYLLGNPSDMFDLTNIIPENHTSHILHENVLLKDQQRRIQEYLNRAMKN